MTDVFYVTVGKGGFKVPVKSADPQTAVKNIPGVEPGVKITIEGCQVESLNGEWIVGVEHQTYRDRMASFLHPVPKKKPRKKRTVTEEPPDVASDGGQRHATESENGADQEDA